LTDLFDRHEIQRFCATLAGVVFLGLLLSWSIWSMRPFKLTLGLRIRTMMLAIAIVPLELTGGMAVWNGWAEWDRAQRSAAYEAFWSNNSS
jgi:hypothetical protein